MNLLVFINTLINLRFKQLRYQLRYRLFKARYRDYEFLREIDQILVFTGNDKIKCLNNNEFCFLNISDHFKSWCYSEYGMLWTYNLNYMDWLMQSDMTVEEGTKWINKFIDELPSNTVGLDPYPIALRGINWIKFILKNRNKIEEDQLRKWNNSLYSQYILLTKKLEYHLLGNHLLEDAYSLFIASIYFCDLNFYKISVKLLRYELNEQVLQDGSHYEQSPMYHCILLDRLLDCCNFSFNNILFDGQTEFNEFLRNKAKLMLGHLECICYSDGTFPLFNDSAIGISPKLQDLKDYALQLGITWDSIRLKESGYRKMQNELFEVFIDVGNITASYQPGHTHADTFNYELRVNGRPFIVDTGISTYNKTARRQEERGTAAHNTVTIDGRNSSEVWGGFRVGKRAMVTLLKDDSNEVVASHDGFGKLIHTRKYTLREKDFTVNDSINPISEAVSHIHLAPTVNIISCDNHEVVTDNAVIKVIGAINVEVVDCNISEQYNVLLPAKAIKIQFNSNMSYSVYGLCNHNSK